ncbi:MAG: APC family permease [Acidimicrobiia bacterium]|nr:APC family permease [Acidimicrobiia bacterium]
MEIGESSVPDSTSGLQFPGWGTATRIEDLGSGPVAVTHLDSGVVHKLGQWRSTAICGNDITSSCLYVSALCAIYAGPYAPLSLLAVALVLYLFRSIYAEVGSALPLNGGAYNVLLNTTTKAKASGAACLTMLSYVATAVISAYEAMHYAHNLWEGLDVFWATIVLLGIFAVLNLIGITESANVALGMFIFHIFTLTLLVVICGWRVMQNGEILSLNWNTPTPDGAAMALFFGFAAAMLGISGFESSANFIEEQAEGVFPQTLRNMWIAVAFFNPMISFLAMGMMPLAEVGRHKEDLLAQMGLLSGGEWLQNMVSLNAVMVLSGAVLTSYVGITGLVRRMSLDQCLPQFLLAENKWRHTNHWIIVLFFLVCCSILAISGGEVAMLAGVYTLSFLGVMMLFAVGNMLLKVKRARLAREYTASWPGVLTALLAVIIGLAGTLVLNPAYVRVFVIYSAVAVTIVGLMFLRVQLLRLALTLIKVVVARIRAMSQKMNQQILNSIHEINSREVIYFSRGDNLEALNRAALYVLNNEVTNNLKVVHCYEQEAQIAENLSAHLETVDRLYPLLRIDLVLVKGKFGPELIERLSQRLGVPKNYMFMGTPGGRFPHNIAELGGVRLIM